MSAAIRGFALLAVCTTVFAAVHDYHDDYFFAVADAYIFRGGREGLFASSAEVSSDRFLLGSEGITTLFTDACLMYQTGSEEVGRLWPSCTWCCQWTI